MTVPGSLFSVIVTPPPSVSTPLSLAFNGTNGSHVIVNDGTYTGPVTNNATLTTTFYATGSACLEQNSSLVYPADPALTLGTKDFTIEFWVFLNSKGMFSSSPVGGSGWDINLGNTYYNAASWLSYGNQTSSHWGGNGPGWGTLSLNKWYYITLTRRGAVVYTHLNGVYIGSTTIGASTTLTGDTNNSGISIGFAQGKVDDFKLTIGAAKYEESVNFTPPALDPSYYISSYPVSINEGATGSYSVTTYGVADGTTLYWTANDTTTSPVDFGATSGSFTITDGSGSFSITPAADYTTEGSETFTVSVRTESTTGTVVASTGTISVNDTSVPTYTFTTTPTSIDEGAAGTFAIETVGVANGTTLYWTVNNTFTTNADFPATSGTFTINNGVGSFSVTPTADLLTEGSETFTVSVRTTDVSGPVGATSSAVTINDVSVTGYAFTTTPASINEGAAGTFAVSAINATDGTTLYWTINNVSSSSADFSATSGSFTVTSNSGSFSVTPTADLLTEGSESFTVSIRIGSTSGTIAVTSNPVTINDTSITVVDTYWNNVSSLFHFDGANGSTTFTDQVLPSRSMSITTGSGTSISTVQSKFGGASLYHSSGSSIGSSVADTTWDITGGDFTVETWIYLTSYNPSTYNGHAIASNVNGTGGSGWYLGLAGVGTVTNIGLYTFNAGAARDSALSSAVSIPLNTWTHVAVSYVFSTKTYSFYLNGVKKGTAASAGAVAAGGPLYIGLYSQNAGYPSNTWTGYLDELRISKGVSRYSADFAVQTAAFPDSPYATGRGYFAGGQSPSSSEIDGIDMNSDTAINPSATISVARAPAGVNSSGRGYFMGGDTGSYSVTIDGITFANELRATISSTLAQGGTNYAAGVNSATTGYVAGGVQSGASLTAAISKFPFSTETSSAIAATLVTANKRRNLTGVSSTTNGYFAGGYISAVSNEIDGIIYATEAFNNPAATLAVARMGPAGVNSSTVGYFGGGYTANNGTPSTEIDGLTFATEAATNPSATLATARAHAAGVNTSSAGYFAGGSGAGGTGGGNLFSSIEKFNFTSLSNTATSAALVAGRYGAAGVQSGAL